MLIERRNALMAGGGGGSPLPPEYQLVEYLRSEGRTQYILLGSAVPSTVEFELTAAIYSLSYATANGKYLVGAYNYNSGRNQGGVLMGKPFNQIWFEGDTTVTTVGTVEEGVPVDISYMDDVIRLLPDGQGTSVLWKSTTLTPVQIRLFSTSMPNNALDAAIYRAKFWVDGTLTWDICPCYRKSDNVAGYYNLVDGTFYTNSGTGSFTIGPAI